MGLPQLQTGRRPIVARPALQSQSNRHLRTEKGWLPPPPPPPIPAPPPPPTANPLHELRHIHAVAQEVRWLHAVPLLLGRVPAIAGYVLQSAAPAGPSP